MKCFLRQCLEPWGVLLSVFSRKSPVEREKVCMSCTHKEACFHLHLEKNRCPVVHREGWCLILCISLKMAKKELLNETFCRWSYGTLPSWICIFYSYFSVLTRHHSARQSLHHLSLSSLLSVIRTFLLGIIISISTGCIFTRLHAPT